jgi:SPP1 family predicted phage head-tail adaptor
MFNGAEGNEMGRETATVPVNFTIWFRDDVNEGMRISYNSQYFDITRVNHAGQRNEMLKLVTTKKY